MLEDYFQNKNKHPQSLKSFFFLPNARLIYLYRNDQQAVLLLLHYFAIAIIIFPQHDVLHVVSSRTLDSFLLFFPLVRTCQ